MMLAEHLLLAKGFHLPTRERETLAALDQLREPPGVVMRRRARLYATKAITGAKPREIEDGTHDNIGGVGIPITDEQFRLTAPDRPDGRGHAAAYLQITPELVAAIPRELRPYLTREAEMGISYDVEMFVKTLMCTGGLYRLDGGEDGTQGVLDSIWGGLPIGDLPPLPYPRMWFEARNAQGQFVPLWKGDPPEGSWNGLDAGVLWALGITEITPGTTWGVIVVRQPDWTYEADDEDRTLSALRYERIHRVDLQMTPMSAGAMFVMPDDEDGKPDSEAAYRGAMASWALVLADIVTARNVDRREAPFARKTRKQLQRAAPGGRFAPRLYNVSIATATDDPLDETHRSLSVRFLVRGHWRVSKALHAKWIDSKEAHCVWVAAYVKGPAGAPWKGRPVYVEPPSTVGHRES